MRTIKTLAGTTIELDGDALLVIETVQRDLTRRHELAYSFEDVDREIQHVIDQMREDELRVYVKEFMFMSFVRYDNERLLAVVKRASLATPVRAKGRTEGKGQRAKGKVQRAKTDTGQRSNTRTRQRAKPRSQGPTLRRGKHKRRRQP